VAKAKAPALERLAARLTRARLCYGRPVEAHGRTVIPVARISLAGGVGSVSKGQAREGGGGNLQARPVGFIEISSDGTRFERIEQPSVAARLAGGALLAGGVAAALVARRRGVRLRVASHPRRRLLRR
jgi:uncharacterized spore protein YtfJ